MYQRIILFLKLVFSPRCKVLYVSGCRGGPLFYRCLNQKEELNKFGISAFVQTQFTPLIFLFEKKYEIFIFQRVLATKSIFKLLERIKNSNKIIFFEVDDLVFEPAYIPYMDGFDAMIETDKKWYRNGIGKEMLEDPYVKNVIVSTKYLKNILQSKYPKKTVFLSENKLNKKQVYLSQLALKNKEKYICEDRNIRIAYFSGSKSHDKDFNVIKNVLIDLLKKNENVKLLVVGFLHLSDEFNDFVKQIEFIDFKPIEMLPNLILRSDINIAPLEINNPFCQAKSAIKYFEAALLKVPTIATATESFKSVITHGKDGFLAKNTNDWSKYLNLLIHNKKIRKLVGEEAYKSTYKNHVIQNISKPSPLIQYLKRKSK